MRRSSWPRCPIGAPSSAAISARRRDLQRDDPFLLGAILLSWFGLQRRKWQQGSND
jgi:hypothetical protein